MTLASKLKRHRQVFSQGTASSLKAPKADREGKGFSPLSPPPALKIPSTSFTFEPLEPVEELPFPAVPEREEAFSREFSFEEELAFTKREFSQTMEEG